MIKDNFIYGLNAVMEALKEEKDIDRVLIQKDLRSPHLTELRKLLKQNKVASQMVPVQKLNQIAANKHQGIIASISPIEYQPLHEIVSAAYEKGESPLILMLDRVSDVGNFGAICRTAKCAGVHAIVIPVKGSAQINAESIKRSAGALLSIPIAKERDLAATAEELQESGLQIIACTEKSDDLMYRADFSQPSLIIMGSEENGINSHLLKLANQRVKIPMFTDLDSLNVSVSAGIILYEAIRQKNAF